jgi:hypothetical protein
VLEIELEKIVEKDPLSTRDGLMLAPMASASGDTDPLRMNAFCEFDPTRNAPAGYGFKPHLVIVTEPFAARSLGIDRDPV